VLIKERATVFALETYIAELLEILLVRSLLHHGPCLLRKLVGDVVLIELAILGAIDGFVA
jgi:hypothetical protein